MCTFAMSDFLMPREVDSLIMVKMECGFKTGENGENGENGVKTGKILFLVTFL